MLFTKSFLVNVSALAVLGLAFAACVSRTDTAIIQQNQAIGANASGGQKIVVKTAASGQTIEIVSMQQVNPDCTAQDPGILRIVQPPEHGQAVIVRRDRYPAYKPNNPLSVCNKTKVSAAAIDYTPNAEFTGSDLMSFEGIFNSGLDTGETKVIITVK